MAEVEEAIVEEPGAEEPEEEYDAPAKPVLLDTSPEDAAEVQPEEPEVEPEEGGEEVEPSAHAELSPKTPPKTPPTAEHPATGALSDMKLPPLNSPAKARAEQPAASKKERAPSTRLPRVKAASAREGAASPTRVRGRSPGRPGAAGSVGSGGDERSQSPGSNGWNVYGQVARNGPRRDYTISEVSGEERVKRKQWAAEARARREAKAKLEADREMAEAARKRAAEEERLEARRIAIRERIERQHEIARKNAEERAAAEARARAEVEQFLQSKPLHEKLAEEYEMQHKAEEDERMQAYHDDLKNRKARPGQILSGEVVVKPMQSLETEAHATMFHDDLIDEEHGVPSEQDDEITQEDAWAVISAFFEEKGLVRQQLDSFNEFVSNTMQEIIDEMPEIVVRPESQHIPGVEQPTEDREMRITFGQIYLAKPIVTEADNETSTLFPKEARLRNLTYSAPMYVDLTKTEIIKTADGETEEKQEKYEKVFLAKVPIMLRSSFCSLNEHTDKELTELGEDPYDSGGYFVINGSEKVLIAQERMANNHVYCFKKSQPSKYSYVAEIRSVLENSTRNASGMSVKMLSRGYKQKGVGGAAGVIRAQIPYIKSDIPILILFRALGLEADKEILEHIVYDFGDADMMNSLRPSIEEAQPVQSTELALDYIGKRGAAIGVTRSKRIEYAKEILQKEPLPTV
ncbi:hypothetical protein FOA52_010749 [Chlamydomonas sp. UWO 241]|nr:hypothetical protein FOA52_010749 [Chlamydomonas sp. UWO 241]